MPRFTRLLPVVEMMLFKILLALILHVWMKNADTVVAARSVDCALLCPPYGSGIGENTDDSRGAFQLEGAPAGQSSSEFGPELSKLDF
jgi:hypothetical protein